MPTLAEPFPPPPFTGFSPDALAFLRELTANNERDWFNANKSRYETVVRDPLISLAADLAARLVKAKLPLRADPKKTMFRIHRDVRFSKDKSPYKTHAGAVLSRNGEKMAPGSLYVHIDPAGSMVVAGFYRPEPPVLAKLRRAVVADPAGWGKVVAALKRGGFALETTEALARLPKGFESAPAALAGTLKMKSWYVKQDLSATQIKSAALIETLAAFAGKVAPLLRFGWAALDQGSDPIPYASGVQR